MSKKITKTDIKKAAMIKALEKTLGVVSTACEIVDIARQTHYEWYREDAEYKKSVDEIGDIALDYGESALHKLIEKGDTAAVIFFMKTKGRKRGYGERIQVEQKEVDNFESEEDLLLELERLRQKDEN